MKPAALAGILLLIVGIIGLAGNISFTTKKAALDLGPVEITKEEKHTIPKMASGAAVLAGIVLLVVGARKP